MCHWARALGKSVVSQGNEKDGRGAPDEPGVRVSGAAVTRSGGDHRTSPDHRDHRADHHPDHHRIASNHSSNPPAHADRGAVYAALDLGTNNCRLLIAHPTRRGFRVVDAFSRIIRLGEGLSKSGRLSDLAMDRTIEALRVCASKLNRVGHCRSRLVATEACRVAENGRDFLKRVDRELGLAFEILTPEQEARLAVSGCVSLIDESADYVLVFDIGGGSSEIIWLDITRSRQAPARRGGETINVEDCLVAWTSLPIGVVTLAEKFGGKTVTPEAFEAMVSHVTQMIQEFEARYNVRARISDGSVHMLGTSGTVTTVAGIQMGLQRYDRNRVDGYWLATEEVRDVTYNLLGQTYEQRVAQPCIGRDRADLVLAGCAILEGFLRMWPCDRLRVADRGLREGILSTLMREDGVYRTGRRKQQGAPPREPGR